MEKPAKPTSPALENVEDIYPLTPLQEGMVFHAIAEPTTSLHVGRIVCEVRGKLDVGALRDAWNQVLARHPALRTAFIWEGLEAPMQVVRAELSMPFQHHDWSDLQADQAGRDFDAWLREETARGFDLTDAPLARVDVFSFTQTSHRLVWSCHHAIADGWSTGVILEELLTLTSGAGNTLLPPAPRYRNHIAWLLKRDAGEDERFWRGFLKGFEQCSSIETPRPSASDDLTAERRHYTSRTIPENELRPIASAAAASRVTLNSLFQAAWSLVLSRYSASDDVVFGVVSSGRPDGVQGVEHMVGLLVTTTPMRVRVSDQDSARAFLRHLQDDGASTRRHEHAALTDIQSWSDVAAGEALFDCLYVFGNYPPQTTQPGAALQIDDVQIRAPSTFPLAILVDPDGSGGVVVTAVTDPSRYDDDTARRLVEAVITTAHVLAEDLDASVVEIDCLPPTEREELDRWMHGDAIDAVSDDIVGMIEEAAARAPDAIAVAGQGETLTYAALLAFARSGADDLISRGVQPGEPVLVQIDRGPRAIVGILAVLLAGGAYVPLDPTYPPSRRRLVASDSRARFMMTAGDRTDGFDGVVTIDLDELSALSRSAWRRPDVPPETPAYIIYTSGSSGRPKGVVVSRANLAFSNATRRAFYREPPTSFLLLSSLAFDSSVVGLFWTLSTGGKLVVAEHRLEQDVEHLAERIAEHQVSHLLCLPSLYAVLIEHADRQKLSSLSHAIVAGEACPPSLPKLHRKALPTAKLINEYGPTEATVWCTAADITDAPADRTPTIGRPIPGTTVQLFDHRNRLVPIGVVGEVMVGGPGVALGYHGQAEMIAPGFVLAGADGSERFYKTGDYARWRDDGMLDYLGRRDGQLKIRGYRIDLAEIEAALETVAVVRATAVIPSKVEGRDVRLAAFVEGDEINTDALRHDLRDRLSDAMLPATIDVVSTLPRLPNGKIDRKQLERRAEADDQHRTAPIHRPPTTPFEKTMVEIWRKVLKVEQVGIGDDFFALGGDSLASIRIVSLAKREGLTIKPTSVLEYPTIEVLARSIERAKDVPKRSDRTSARRFFMVHGGDRMHDYLRDALSDHHDIHMFRDHWDDGCLAPTTSIQGMADSYLAELLAIAPHGPYLLGGYSIGGAVAIVMARRLMAAGEEVEMLFLLDPPDRIDYLGGVQGLDEERLNALSGLPPSKTRSSTATTRLADVIAKKYQRYLRGPSRLLRGALAYYTGRSLSPSIASHYAWIVYSLAIGRHEIAPYAGRLWVFRSVQDRDPDGGYVWAELARGDYAEERFVCEHLAFRRDPQMVKTWTARLARHLGELT